MLTVWNEFRSIWRARALVNVLTRREIAGRHAGTAAGIFWLYIQPLFSVAAFYLVFDVVFAMRQGSGAHSTGVGTFLVVGALPWMAFCDALMRGMNSLLDAGGLLQKNPMPPVFFVVKSVLASSVIFGPLLLLMGLAYAPLHGFAAALWALLPLLLLQVLLSFLLAYTLAILAAALRDTVQFVGFLVSVGIYLTPVLFPVTLFPENWRWLLWLNPMTAFVLAYQQILLQGAWPDPGVWAAVGSWTLVVGASLNVLVKRSRDQLVDWL